MTRSIVYARAGHRPGRVSFASAMIALVVVATPIALRAPARAQDRTPDQTAVQPSKRAWSERLEQLDSTRPIDYFLLAEEVADAATSVEDRTLARQLFGLAGALAPQELGRSAALALASLAEDDRERRTLRALASLLAADDEAIAAQESLRGRPSPQHALALSEAFSQLRRGQGPRATAILKTPEVAELLDTHAGQLPGGADRFREDCRAFKGGVRPAYADSQRLLMLEIELAVLAMAAGTPTATGGAREVRVDSGWSSALVATSGAPLLELDTARLEKAFGVDPARSTWRNGQWERPAR
jgi:hypothetical protein